MDRTNPARQGPATKVQALSAGLIRTFALACGLAVANLYYAQPMLGVIGTTFQVGSGQTGLLVTLTQLGYALGLVLVVPLGDLLENRRLITMVLFATIAALVAAALAPTFALFAAACLCVGVTSVVTQILVPFAAHLAPESSRGRVVGQVMSGLLLGVLLARAVAGLISGWLGWRAVYGLSACMLTVLNLSLGRFLPRRQPAGTQNYGQLLGSLWTIFRSEPVLRRRAAYQTLMFASFSMFWTSVTFLLTDAPFHLSQSSIGLFALVGAVGALSAPLAGRLGDVGRGRVVTGGAFVLAVLGFGLTSWQSNLVALALGAVLLDLAVQTTLVLGQQAIYGLNPEQRSRINTIYIAIFFLGGAAGSALSGVAYAHGGWPEVVWLGAALPLLGFLYWLTER